MMGIVGERHASEQRVIRGGSWNDHPQNVRAAYRNANHPGNRNDDLGFRLARAQAWTMSPHLTRRPSRPLAIRGGEQQRARRRAGRSRGCAIERPPAWPTPSVNPWEGS
ncbi:MAG: SUMF1/EgtB/PvdO family nonheme iron enzyme [Planctomycetota bacterium]